MIRTKFVDEDAKTIHVRLMPSAVRVDELINFKDGEHWRVFGVSWLIGNDELDVEMIVYVRRVK